jgi:hypothetical protein
VFPSKYPENQAYPRLVALLRNQVDMQFDDLRTLMRLPLPEYDLTAGCNLSTASQLFSAIAGASVCFFEPSLQAITNRGDRARRFRDVLRSYYPWDGDDLSVDQRIGCLYRSARNPLAHAFGLGDPNGPDFEVFLAKDPLAADRILELEDSRTRPAWCSPTIRSRRRVSTGAIRVDVSVPALFWGTHQMLRRLLAQADIAAAADEVAGNYEIQWLTLVSDLGSPADE